MNRPAAVWLVIVAAGAGTYAIRTTLMLLARHFATVPPRVGEALRMIPPAALAALATPAILRPDATGLAVADARLIAGVVALMVAWRTKSLAWTILVGLAVVTALEQVPVFG